MLSDEVLDRVIERLTTRINQGNEYIIQKMGKSIKKIGTLTQTQAQQLSQVLKYGGDYEKIVKELSKITKLNVSEIHKIFREVAKSDLEFSEQFYKYRNIKYIPYEENLALQHIVNSVAQITAGEYMNLASTSVIGYAIRDEVGNLIFKNIQQTYSELIDEAVLNVAQGKETFDQVMYRKMKEIGESGLRVVYPTTYVGKDGKEHNYTRRLDSAIAMNMRDGLTNLHNETQQIFGDQFHADGVEITAHENPAPDHEYVQGHQFSYDEFDKFQTDVDCHSYDGTFYPAVSEETGRDRRAIGEYNCYHKTFAIILGVSSPKYSNKQLKKIIDRNHEGFEFEGKHYTNYQGLQLQRQIETAIRKQKDNQILGKSSGNKKLISDSQEKVRLLTEKYRKLNRISGLPDAIARARVSGYKRISKKKLQ